MIIVTQIYTGWAYVQFGGLTFRLEQIHLAPKAVDFLKQEHCTSVGIMAFCWYCKRFSVDVESHFEWLKFENQFTVCLLCQMMRMIVDLPHSNIMSEHTTAHQSNRENCTIEVKSIFRESIKVHGSSLIQCRRWHGLGFIICSAYCQNDRSEVSWELDSTAKRIPIVAVDRATQ